MIKIVATGHGKAVVGPRTEAALGVLCGAVASLSLAPGCVGSILLGIKNDETSVFDGGAGNESPFLANHGPQCAGELAGLYCGNDGLGGDPNTLFRCTGGNATVVELCTNGCQTMPRGTDDICKPRATCPSGDGQYCGGDMISGRPDTLYQCSAGTLSIAQRCQNGCQVEPPGVNDKCR